MDKLKKNKQQKAESNKNLDKTSNIKKKKILRLILKIYKMILKKLKKIIYDI